MTKTLSDYPQLMVRGQGLVTSFVQGWKEQEKEREKMTDGYGNAICWRCGTVGRLQMKDGSPGILELRCICRDGRSVLEMAG